MHRHPEGRRQSTQRLIWSAHSHEHCGGLLCSHLPERLERDVCRKVGGVVNLTPLTQPHPSQNWQLTMPHTDWDCSCSLTNFLGPHWPNVALMQRAWLRAFRLSAPSLWSWMCCDGLLFFLFVFFFLINCTNACYTVKVVFWFTLLVFGLTFSWFKK